MIIKLEFTAEKAKVDQLTPPRSIPHVAVTSCIFGSPAVRGPIMNFSMKFSFLVEGFGFRGGVDRFSP